MEQILQLESGALWGTCPIERSYQAVGGYCGADVALRQRSWTMTAARERRVRGTQRRMLRWMLGSFWRKQTNAAKQEEQEEGSSSSTGENSEDESAAAGEIENEENEENAGESWVEWIRRTTHLAEDYVRQLGLED